MFPLKNVLKAFYVRKSLFGNKKPFLEMPNRDRERDGPPGGDGEVFWYIGFHSERPVVFF